MLVVGVADAATPGEVALLKGVNAARVAGATCGRQAWPGRAAFRPRVDLNRVAKAQALVVARSGRVTHEDASGAGSRERVFATGLPAGAASENVYLGFRGGWARALEWWMRDRVHCENVMQGRYVWVGVGSATGKYGTAWVLVFAGP